MPVYTVHMSSIFKEKLLKGGYDDNSKGVPVLVGWSKNKQQSCDTTRDLCFYMFLF